MNNLASFIAYILGDALLYEAFLLIGFILLLNIRKLIRIAYRRMKP